jgi:Ca-activated chloride channel family protein
MDTTQRSIAGLLALALAPAFAATPDEGQVMIVLDASGSMWGQIDGKPKLEIARETLAGVLADTPAGTQLGLIAYGHRSKGDCKDIELVVPAGPGTAPAISSAAAKMKFLGMTPLSDAVTLAARELRHNERRATVVLITDGLETCKADPCAVGKALEESGVDFTAHVVGFGLSAEEGKQVACLAENTGGRYFAANDASALAAAISQTVVQAPPVAPAPPAGLDAPDSVPMSSRFSVSWTGPGDRYDDVQVFDPAGRGGLGLVADSQRVRSDAGFGEKKVTVVAPAVPGDYQLRYYHGELRRVIATRPLQVVATEVALSAPDEVAIASRITVGWTGPGARFDDVQVFDPAARGGQGQVLDSQRVATDKDAARRQVTVVAPAVPGDYQLRYYNGDNREVLATRPLRVVAVEVSLDAPASVPMASRITVGWTGPGARFDELQLFDPAAKGGDGRLVDSQRVATDKGAAQKQATVVAPAVPGQYELRYYNGDNRTVLATRPITVTAIEVSLQAPDRAPVDSPITVRWTGPGATFDNIEIHDPAARNGEGQLVVNRRITTDPGYARREATLRTPKVPGTYQLRYYNGDNRAVLATRPLIVE